MEKGTIKPRYRIKRFCPTCNERTPRIGKISLHSPKGEMDEDFPVFRVDYPCICGHNDYKLFYGFIELTDPEDFITLFADYPKKKKPRVKEKHYPGLFGHLIPKKEWPKCPRE